MSEKIAAPSAPTRVAPSRMATTAGGGVSGFDWNRMKANIGQGAQNLAHGAQEYMNSNPHPAVAPAATAAAGALGGAALGGISSALSNDPYDTAADGAVSGALKGGLAGGAVGGAFQMGHTMGANPHMFKAAEFAELIPTEIREKIAAAGGHRVLAHSRGVNIVNLREALEKIGFDMFMNDIPEVELKSMIESYRIATEK